MTISESLADILLAMDFERLPPIAVSSAKKLLLDHFCAAAVGSFTPWGRAVASVGRQFGGTAESSIYFTREKLPAPTAAFINGTYAHSFELDDHGGPGLHAGAVVIPAAIAAGQRRGIDGRTFITAMISGYEVLSRLSRAMGEMIAIGHHPTGTLGPFGSAVAAGRVLGLEREQLISALGLAGNFPTGVTEFYKGGMEKRLFAGRAAESGVLSCLLAVAGVTGARTIFEGELGFCRSFSRHVDLDKILEGLGEKYYVNEFRIKHYPCAGFPEPYIEAALLLHNNNSGIFRHSENVSAVIIEGRKLVRGRTELHIREVMAAQYSIPYIVAVALCHGQPSVRAFLDAGINDPGVQRLLERCQIVRQDDYPGIGRVTVKLKDGTTLTEEAIDTHEFFNTKPIAEVAKEEIINKGIGVISPSLGLKGAQELVEALDKMVAKIEDTTDIRELMESMPGFTLRT